MMLIGFKRQFAPHVEDGSKTHTVRAARVNAPRVGEIAHCYVDPRQKTMRLLGRFPVVRVQEIAILRIDRPGVPLCVEIDGVQLSPDEAEGFFWRDGFRPESYVGKLRLAAFRYPAIEMAAEFWKDREDTFRGLLIHWDYARRIIASRLNSACAGCQI
jgi:hypothetical protein